MVSDEIMDAVLPTILPCYMCTDEARCYYCKDEARRHAKAAIDAYKESAEVEYRAQSSAFNNTIYIGQVSEDGTELVNKQEARTEVMASVAEYALGRYNGVMEVTLSSLTNMPSLLMKVVVSTYGEE